MQVIRNKLVEEPDDNDERKHHKACKPGALQYVIIHHLGEQPVAQAAIYMLRPSRPEVKHENGSDTPGMIIAVLPVEHAVFPIATSLIPPFASIIAVFVGIPVQNGRIAACSCINICRIRSQGVINDFSK